MKNNYGGHGSSDLVERVVYVGKCTKVVKGGRRFKFAVIVVIGDKKGRVGVGLGKAPEVVDAKSKAVQKAKSSMQYIPLKDNRTLYHDVSASYCTAHVIMRSAPPGKGVRAGGTIRVICELLGIKDIVAKSIGSSNAHNTTKAVLRALLSVSTPVSIANKRRKHVSDLFDESEYKPKLGRKRRPRHEEQAEAAPIA